MGEPRSLPPAAQPAGWSTRVHDGAARLACAAWGLQEAVVWWCRVIVPARACVVQQAADCCCRHWCARRRRDHRPVDSTGTATGQRVCVACQDLYALNRCIVFRLLLHNVGRSRRASAQALTRPTSGQGLRAGGAMR